MAARYTRLDITDTEELRPKLAEPFATIFRASTRDVDDSDGAGGNPGDAKREPAIFLNVACSRKTLWVGLPKRFSNKRPALNSLISRVLRGSERRGPRGRATERHDTRGALAKNPAKPQTRLTPERRAELVADYVAGTPVRAIATKYGVHRGTIPTLIRRAGAEVRVAGLDAEESKLASSLYENGMTLAQVAGQMGVSDAAVRQAVVDQGGQIRPKGRRPRREAPWV